MKCLLHLFGALGSLLLATMAQSQTLLLQDSFDAETSFSANPNSDQTGSLAPATYDVGVATTFPGGQQRRGNGVLELGFNGTTSSSPSRVFTNADFVGVTNTLNSPIRITFTIDAAPADWVGFALGTSNAWVDSSGLVTEFSAIFNSTGGGTRWVNGVAAAFTATDTANLITLELRNTAGTGSPFNGTGSVAQLWRGTTNLGTFTLDQLNATNARFAFTTWNGNGGAGATVDNFTITATTSASFVARWSGAVSGSWDEDTVNFSGQSFAAIKNAGSTDVFFGDTDTSLNPVANANVTIAAGGVEIANVIFENANVPYTLASTDANGLTGTSNLIKTGSGLLTLAGENSYFGTTLISAGTLELSGGADRLSVSSALTIVNPGTLRLAGHDQTVASLSGSGRVVNGSETLATLTIDGATSSTFSGNLGGTGTNENHLALVKNGTGTLSLSVPNTFTGGTTIDGGTLLLNFEQAGAGDTALGPITSSNQVTINQGGVLSSNGTANNWLSNTNISAGGANAISVTINEGGTLRGAVNRITGLGQVNLNGGTIEVTNGLNGFGWFAAFNLGGDLFVSGTQPSFITTAAGAGAAANFQLGSGNNTAGGGTRFVIVDDVTGDAAPDLIVSACMAQGTLIKSGAGTVELAAGATGTAFPVSWEIDEGLVSSASDASFEFRLTNATSNRVSGSGAVEFLGAIHINTSAVTLTTASEWSLIDTNGLLVTYAPNFSVTGFTDPDNDGTWVKADAVGQWTFSELTGNVSLTIPSADDFTTWAQSFSLAGGAAGDDDFDGLSNFMEYAFGLLPNNAGSVNPISSPLDQGTLRFSYTRRTPTLSGLAYSVWYSTDLVNWTRDTLATEAAVVIAGEIQTVTMALSSQVGSPTPQKLFVQVRAVKP
jgi:autotransporter-associated beta strand protein